MARRNSRPAEIVEAVHARLIAAVAAFSEHNCLICQPDQDWHSPPGDTWATIWIASPQFDAEQIDGGMATATMMVIITLHNRIVVDKAGEDRKALTDSSRGLLKLADTIFQKLWLHDLTSDGDQILREPMRPVSLSEAQRVPSEGGRISFAWECVFDWYEE